MAKESFIPDTWLSSTDFHHEYVGGDQKFKDLIKTYSSDATIVKEGVKKRGKRVTFYLNPDYKYDFMKKNNLELRLSEHEYIPDHWISSIDLEKKYMGKSQKLRLLIKNFSENEEIVKEGRKRGSGNKTFYLNSKYEVDFIKKNDLELMPNKDEYVPADWLSANDLVKKYVGSSVKLRLLIKNFSENEEIVKEGRKRGSGNKTFYLNPKYEADCIKKNDLELMPNKDEYVPDDWLSGTDFEKEYIGKAEKLRLLIKDFSNNKNIVRKGKKKGNKSKDAFYLNPHYKSDLIKKNQLELRPNEVNLIPINWLSSSDLAKKLSGGNQKMAGLLKEYSDDEKVIKEGRKKNSVNKCLCLNPAYEESFIRDNDLKYKDTFNLPYQHFTPFKDVAGDNNTHAVAMMFCASWMAMREREVIQNADNTISPVKGKNYDFISKFKEYQINDFQNNSYKKLYPNELVENLFNSYDDNDDLKRLLDDVALFSIMKSGDDLKALCQRDDEFNYENIPAVLYGLRNKSRDNANDSLISNVVSLANGEGYQGLNWIVIEDNKNLYIVSEDNYQLKKNERIVLSLDMNEEDRALGKMELMFSNQSLLDQMVQKKVKKNKVQNWVDEQEGEDKGKNATRFKIGVTSKENQLKAAAGFWLAFEEMSHIDGNKENEEEAKELKDDALDKIRKIQKDVDEEEVLKSSQYYQELMYYKNKHDNEK